jgi:hypothetical protein
MERLSFAHRTFIPAMSKVRHTPSGKLSPDGTSGPVGTGW